MIPDVNWVEIATENAIFSPRKLHYFVNLRWIWDFIYEIIRIS